ncbi:MAG: alpha/beta hydrolase [Planctomycetota bacterium]|nr:alpha/beta hydrolase [Planctomycetota bacterium]
MAFCSAGRSPLFIICFVAAEVAVFGLSAIACGSAAEAVYVAAIPGFAIYAAMFRRTVLKRLSWKHGAYLAALSVAVGGYLIAFTYVNPYVRIGWQEILVCIYFLAALHILLWSGDQVFTALLSRAFGIAGNPPALGRRVAAKTVLRLAALVLVGGPFAASALVTHWPKFQDALDPKELCDLEYQQMGFYTRDQVRLEGWFIPATANTSDTTVIVVPGRGVSKSCFLPHAMMLADWWFNVLLLDLRGEGDSDGHTRGFGVIEAQDVVGALDCLRQARPQQSRHVFVLGISQGAAAALAAARTDDRIEAVVADSVFPSPAAELRGLTAWLPWPLDWHFEQTTLLFASLELGRNLFREGPYRDIAAVSPRPVLLIHGREDTVIPPREAEGLFSAAGYPAMLWQVRDAGHAEGLQANPANYARVVSRMLLRVRMGLPPFPQAGPERVAHRG